MPEGLAEGSSCKLMFVTHTGPVLGTAQMLTPVSRNLQPFRFVALHQSDKRKLGEAIQREVTRLHTPRAIEAYNSGAPVVFGPFTLGMQGISNGRETLPWNRVKSININRGTVS